VEFAGLRVGTSSWSSPDWRGKLYDPGSRPRDFLEQYARHFDTVECDATFYGVPRPTTVDGWRSRTPEGFLLSSKLPREITHERGLVDCGETLNEFLGVMGRLGHRLGPTVAQFAYVAKRRDAREYETGDDFRSRLRSFLDLWPKERQLAVEVRNAKWVAAPLLDLLQERGVCLVLPAIYTMPGPARLFGGPRPVTTNLIYVRFLGHHREMDQLIARQREQGRRDSEWGELALDRSAEMREWVAPLRAESLAGARVLVYFNNHYAGYAPGSVTEFKRLWNAP
jgi:uncharacterized protein YecE (DUF72 family)